MDQVEEHLPGHIRAVQASGHPVIWICDPMHGKCAFLSSCRCRNYHSLAPRSTLTSSSGLKTRNFGTIISELTSCIRVHTECDSQLNGVSLEFTGELADDGFSVTECLGGSMGLSEDHLPLRYQVRRSRSSNLALAHLVYLLIYQSFCDPRLNFEQSLGMCNVQTYSPYI